MRWIRGLGDRLGYGGRSDRREFVAGVSLTIIGPLAVSMVVSGSIPRLFAVFPREVALVLSLIVAGLVLAGLVAWFWGGTVFLTRRARDIGLPAWTGVVSVIAMALISRGVDRVLPVNLANAVGWLLFVGFILVWAVWPGRGGSWKPAEMRPRPSAEPA